MKPTIFLISLLLILACLVIPAQAVVYSEEYYTLDSAISKYFDVVENISPRWSYELDAQVITYYELRRQTILMEKQNELLEEQNGLLRNLTNQTR